MHNNIKQPKTKRDEGANPWSSRDDDHFSILLWVHLWGVYLEADIIWVMPCKVPPCQRQGQQVAEEVCKTLSRDRSEAAFDLFWTRLLKRKSEVDAVA